jgi:class 3 adenylate cyclase
MWCGYLSGIIAEMTVVTTMCIVAGVSTVMGYLTMKHIVSLWAAYCTFYITTLFLESDDVRLLKLIIPFFLFMCLYGMLLMSDVLKKQIITNKRLLATARRDSSVIRQRTREVEEEKQKSEDLLLNILPAETAEELKQSGVAKAKTYSMVTVMFTDFKGFTKVSEKVSAELLVAEIDCCFSAFDEITQRYGLEKIKTVGDAYICAGGLPVPNYTHAADMVNAALEICDFIETRRKEKESRGEPPFEIRIGIHTGPVVAGIVGKRKFAYDIWGDTVNTAARMEQNSEAGKINISETTYELIKGKFPCNFRGEIDAKNKGKLKMYFVEGVV